MDGSTSSFLRDTPFFSTPSGGSTGGILYVEDFGNESEIGAAQDENEPALEPAPPPISQDDLDGARREGFAAGTQAALADARLVQSQLHDSAIQSLADALSAARVELERVALRQAGEAARVVIAVLQAAIPATMASHGALEVEAVLSAILPAMACEAELKVRTHPDLADFVRERLAGQLPAANTLLSVTADPSIEAAGLRLAWTDGRLTRDCTLIWNALKAALAPLGLPSIEEICRGNGC